VIFSTEHFHWSVMNVIMYNLLSKKIELKLNNHLRLGNYNLLDLWLYFIENFLLINIWNFSYIFVGPQNIQLYLILSYYSYQNIQQRHYERMEDV